VAQFRAPVAIRFANPLPGDYPVEIFCIWPRALPRCCPARFQVFTTGRPSLILALAGSECVVSVPIEADIDAELGARLAEVRRCCGLTQRQLAKAVGAQLTTVQNWERGRTGLPAKRLAALANALHCQPIDLLMLPGTGVRRERHHLTPRTPGEGDICPAPRQPWPGSGL